MIWFNLQIKENSCLWLNTASPQRIEKLQVNNQTRSSQFFVHNPNSVLRPKEYQYLPRYPTQIIRCSLGCYGRSRPIRRLRWAKLSTERTAYPLNMKLQRTFLSDPAGIQTPTVDLCDVLCNLAVTFLGRVGTNLQGYMASRTRSPHSESLCL